MRTINSVSHTTNSLEGFNGHMNSMLDTTQGTITMIVKSLLKDQKLIENNFVESLYLNKPHDLKVNKMIQLVSHYKK